SQGGQRIYSRDDLEHLRFVIDTMAAGSSPADAHRLLAGELRAQGGVSPARAGRAHVMILVAEPDRYPARPSGYLPLTQGYDVYATFDVEAARRGFADRQADLSVVELMMSGGGLALCRDLARSGDAPVLALSALDLAEEAFAAGASAFVSKPINPLQL